MNKLFSLHSMEVFAKVCNTLNLQNISYWPEFGTLLGIYRDHDFIKHDFDFDFGIHINNLDDVRKLLISEGFEVVHEYEGINHPEIREITFNYLGINVDFFCFNDINDNEVACYLFAHYDMNRSGDYVYKIKQIDFPVFELQRIVFKNIVVLIPKDVETHLKVSYGPSFMIPDPNFKSLHTEYLDGIYAKAIY